jgi:hypothetical protein
VEGLVAELAKPHAEGAQRLGFHVKSKLLRIRLTNANGCVANAASL